MRKFKVFVTQEKEYEIEIDDDKITEEELDSFEELFYDLDQEDDRISSMARDYARLRAIGFSGFIEGYGYVLEDGQAPFEAIMRGLGDKDINTAINFKAIDEDDSDPEIEIEEITKEC